MKKLLFIHGPNGVGKSTLCSLLSKEIMNSAWLESEWARCITPFVFNEDIEILTEKNMTSILRNYLECDFIKVVIFNWGFHESRKKIFERVLKNLEDVEYEYIPITLKCSLEENISRMRIDERSNARIEKAIRIRGIYEELPYMKVDTTDLTPEQTMKEIVKLAKL